MILNLESQLEPILKQAKSFYIATALISESGYQFIEKNVSENCNRNYLLGIDLAVNPKILKKLLAESNKESVNVKICTPKYTFHPKVYLIEKNDGRFAVIIGSANTTLGGLSNNIEMSVLIDSQQQCIEILRWFKNLYNDSIDLTVEFIAEYSKFYKSIKQRHAVNNADLSQFQNSLPKLGLQSIGLEKQYFKFDDFNAFSPAFHRDKSFLAKHNRKEVKLKFIALHHTIFPKFTEYELNNLSHHNRTWNTVSSHAHTARSRPNLDAIWLQYGNNENLTDHPRLQVILRDNTIGIWLMIGKNKGSRKEREQLKTNLKDDLFLELFYNNIKNLGAIYWIDINSKYPFKPLSSIENKEDLKNLFLTDNLNNYLTIGRNFHCTDEQLEDRIFPETVLIEFQRLNQVYKNMIYGMV